MTKWPSQRSSLSGCTERTVGLKRIGVLPGAARRTERRAPCVRVPEIDLMNGFHAGSVVKSVRTDHTRAAGALITILVWIFRAAMSWSSCAAVQIGFCQADAGPGYNWLHLSPLVR